MECTDGCPLGTHSYTWSLRIAPWQPSSACPWQKLSATHRAFFRHLLLLTIALIFIIRVRASTFNPRPQRKRQQHKSSHIILHRCGPGGIASTNAMRVAEPSVLAEPENKQQPGLVDLQHILFARKGPTSTTTFSISDEGASLTFIQAAHPTRNLWVRMAWAWACQVQP